MKLLTVKELAEKINVKEKTLYQWVQLQQIPYLRLNGCVRFNLDDISQWIDSCKKPLSTSYNPLTKLEARKGGTKN